MNSGLAPSSQHQFKNSRQHRPQGQQRLHIAKAFRWQAMIDKGKFASVNELARAIGRDKSYVSRGILFTLLAPEIVHVPLNGKLKKKISVEHFKQAFPADWEEQKKLFEIK